MNQFSDVLRTRYLVIPENQRGFSWRTRHVDDLIKDLQIARDQSHYMGPIIVTRTETEPFQDAELSETLEYTLDDGQQRVTTLILFANQIRARLEEQLTDIDAEGDATLAQRLKDASRDLERLIFYERQTGGTPSPRLKNRNDDLHHYFLYLLTGSPSPPADRSPPMRALDDVHAHISDFVGGLETTDLFKWKNKILHQAKFIWVDLSRESINRYLAFDAINSRGLPLSDFDKIKNFCILLAKARSLSVEPEEAWYQALQSLEKFAVSSRSHEAAFISDLYGAYHAQQVSRSDVHDTFVNRYRKLLTESDADLERDFEGFISHWADYARSYGFVATNRRERYYGNLCTPEAGKWLTRLDNMGLPTIMRPVLTAVHMRRSKTEFESVARGAEIYTFRTHAVRRYRKDKYSAKIVELASHVLKLDKEDGYVLDELCRWLSTLAPLSRVINRLGNGGPKYYHDPNTKGWAHCYYFLYEAEVYFSPPGTSPLNWAATKEGKINTQEHILPQHHRDGGWWESEWGDEAEADRYVHRLGNLVLTANNSALSRKPFPKKVEDKSATHYYKHAQATNTEKRILEATNGKSWKPMNVLRREAELLEFAAKRWSMPCCHDNGLIKAPENWPDSLYRWVKFDVDETKCFGGTPAELETEPPEEELEEDDVAGESDD